MIWEEKTGLRKGRAGWGEITIFCSRKHKIMGAKERGGEKSDC